MRFKNLIIVRRHAERVVVEFVLMARLQPGELVNPVIEVVEEFSHSWERCRVVLQPRDRLAPHGDGPVTSPNVHHQKLDLANQVFGVRPFHRSDGTGRTRRWSRHWSRTHFSFLWPFFLFLKKSLFFLFLKNPRWRLEEGVILHWDYKECLVVVRQWPLPKWCP